MTITHNPGVVAHVYSGEIDTGGSKIQGQPGDLVRLSLNIKVK